MYQHKHAKWQCTDLPILQLPPFSAAVAVIGFVQNVVIVNETDMSVALTVRLLSGALAPGAWAEVEFTTSDIPSYNTSATGNI